MIMRFFLVCISFLFFSINLYPQDSGGFSSSRFIRSNLYAQGEYEFHLFNNYYSQRDKLNMAEDYNSRYDFFTVTAQILIGLKSNLNLGFEIKLRSVSQNTLSTDGVFSALKFKNAGFKNENGQFSGYSRVGFSMFGPKVKYQIFPSLGSFSVLHTLLIPIGKDLGGNNETGYLDWGSPVLMNEVFFDRNFGANWSIFAGTGLFVENINKALLNKDDGFYQFSIPSTFILSRYLFQKMTIYGLLSYAARWENSVSGGTVNSIYNPYYQFGVGLKYWLTNKIEVEFILTGFEDKTQGRTASTINLGFRYFSNR